MTALSSVATHRFEAHHLAYAYPGGPLVVRDVSLTSTPGCMTAVVGANGAGKSTLIRMLAGLLRPASGAVLLDGVPLKDWQPRLRAREIAYVPQSTPTVFPFQVIELVLSGRTPHTPGFQLESSHDTEKAMQALENAGAAHLASRSFTSLSGGERQMVILARALAQEPRFLLLDEPSSSLDLKHRADLIRTLARLRNTQRLSVIMITHDLQLTASFDQLVALRCGEVAAAGTPDEVLRDDLLRDVYGDPSVHSRRIGEQTLIWVDL
ncbi:MAG TPA: ABC transporter ATP-binding protein [Bryobacteraceae bacterium]|nr:ABC transporter ATP-binding protein [Bryobacteraceae bacterium]